jgi:hypothetical protein
MKRGLALCLMAGCGLSNSDASDDPHGPVEPASPALSDTAPYHLTSHVEITAEALSPARAELIVSTLREFSVNPARALITSADAAGVPAVATLYGVLPDIITDRLEGWINEAIAKLQIGGMPVTSYAAEIAALADTALTGFELDSELAIHGAAASHRLTVLDLSDTGLALDVPITGLAGEILSQTPTVSLAADALTLGEQHFGLNYGDHVWQALEDASRARFGGDIRARLGDAISCPVLARGVATRCILPVCVGHEAELTSLCEAGLDAVVDLAHDRMAELRIEALHLASGQATLVDHDGDGIGDVLTGGTWQAEIDLGQGLRHVPAVFAGVR